MIEPVEIDGISQNNESFQNSLESFQFFGQGETEINENESISSKNEENPDKNINEINLGVMASNKENNNKKNKNIFTIKSSTTVGRRPTNITYPEKATHNSNSKDNLIDTIWRDFLNSTVETCNHYGNLKLKNTNFKKQFGSSNIQNQKFINIKFYQYLTYNPPINDKYKSHKFFGSHNEKIIKKVLVGNNEKLKCLLKSKIQDIYNIYIRKGNEKVIIDGIELDYFKKLTDVINEKNKKIKDLSSELKEKKEKEINNYEKQARDLINYIKGAGNDKKRKIEFNDKDTIKYLKIEELE
jgi:hypothetical protein